jgi:hypothetical protein
MSEYRDDLLVTSLDKKRVIKIILVAGLLIIAFAFSTFILNLLWNTQRPPPNDRLEDAEEEDAILVDLPPPFDFSDIPDFLDNLNLTQDQLQDLLDSFSDMFDGNIDDLDLSDMSLAALALLGSQIEVFRVFDFGDINQMTSKLWKFECFDEFLGEGWHSTFSRYPYNYYSYQDHSNYHWDKQIFKISMPLSPTAGINSMVIPNLFPSPFIMEDSVYADNLDPASEVLLFKDDMNCTTLDLTFENDFDSNLNYNMFGLNLPTNDEINNSAADENDTPQSIKDQFLQLPALNKNDYLNPQSRPSVLFHYNTLLSIIKPEDNAFMVANKIRNYLQSPNFSIGFDALQNDPPGDDEDIVEWFCEHREGLWPEFASAFTIFCRLFNVSSRFVDGFNSQGIIQEYDPIEGKDYFAIKYANLYNWAEIYVPLSPSNGYWVQMDILYDSYGVGGTPLSSYNITVSVDKSVIKRPDFVNITAELSSLYGLNVDNKRIEFYDATSQSFVGEAFTDQNGIASFITNIDFSQVVGPHAITAYFQGAADYDVVTILGNIQVNLTSANPSIVNISDSLPDAIRVQGFMYDPINYQTINNAMVTFRLFQAGTSNEMLNPFNPLNTFTDDLGMFDIQINLNPTVPRGNYEIRVDFNGTWGFHSEPNINSSSNKRPLTIIEELTSSLYFYINNNPTNYPFSVNPINLLYAKRAENLNLSISLIQDIDGSPISGENVNFYDYTNGNIWIGSDVTDSNGNANILYNLDSNIKSGPNLLYVNAMSKANYSYFILNETILFDFFSGPEPREVNRTGDYGTTFNLDFQLIDNFNNPIYYSQIHLNMHKLGFDYSYYLDPNYPFIQDTIGSNYFNFNVGVTDDAVEANYTLRLDFYGVFNFGNDIYNPYPAYFNINDLARSYNLPNELKIIDPENLTLYLAVEGNPTGYYDNFYKPERYNRGEIAHFQVFVVHSLPLDGRTLRIYDDYQNIQLQTYTFSGLDTGFVEFNLSTDLFLAGLNRLRVEYDVFNTINKTYIIINETIDININSDHNVLLRNDSGMNVFGNVEKYGLNMRGMVLKILLLDSDDNDISSYLSLPYGPNILIDDTDGSFMFNINSVSLNCLQGEYNLRVDFNGTLNAPGLSLTDYMIHTSSFKKALNITAATIITQDSMYTDYEIQYPELKDLWVEKGTLYVIGTLTWDNGTAISGMRINVTVKLLDGTIVQYNDTIFTDAFGEFNVSIYIDPNNDLWPTQRNQTEVWVYFDPTEYNLELVKPAAKLFI